MEPHSSPVRIIHILSLVVMKGLQKYENMKGLQKYKKQQICLHSFSLEFPFLGTFQYSYLSYTLSKIEVKPWTKAFSSLLRLSEKVDLF